MIIKPKLVTRKLVYVSCKTVFKKNLTALAVGRDKWRTREHDHELSSSTKCRVCFISWRAIFFQRRPSHHSHLPNYSQMFTKCQYRKSIALRPDDLSVLHLGLSTQRTHCALSTGVDIWMFVPDIKSGRRFEATIWT